MHLETLDRLPTSLCRSQILWLIVWWIVFARFRELHDYMLDLYKTSEVTLTSRARELTWFISVSVPMFSPPATASSKLSSKRFFSLTTVFKKSVLSICGAYICVNKPKTRHDNTLTSSLSKYTWIMDCIVSPIWTSSKNCISGATLVVSSCSAGRYAFICCVALSKGPFREIAKYET